MAPYLLPRILRHFSRTHPSLEIRPREAITQKLLADLLEARIDLALLALPTGESSLTEVPLLKEEFVLVRPADQANLPAPSFASLSEMQLLLLEEGHCLRDQALSVCRASAAKDLIEGSSLSTLVQMVAAGLGVTLIPEMAVPLETRQAEVSLIKLRPPPDPRARLEWSGARPTLCLNSWQKSPPVCPPKALSQGRFCQRTA